jgi:hypothetical protein
MKDQPTFDDADDDDDDEPDDEVDESKDGLRRGREAADAAIERVGANADPEWKAECLRVIERTAMRLPKLTTDDLWVTLDREGSPRERRVMGNTIKEAAKAGWITWTVEQRPSNRPVCHANPKRVWRSNIYEGPTT